MGPQVLLPEEIITVPTAFAAGMTMGNAKTNMEIEGGRAYLEMLDNGVSEETARAIATGVGGVNAALETLQLDEILKAYKVLNKAGADDAFLNIVLRELKNRGIDTVTETLQEDLQELVTIGGTQLGSKIDTGEWAYNIAETLSRLWDTAKESALTFGLTNIPAAGHNVYIQNYSRLIAAGKANILAGKMPTAEQLQEMNMSETEARDAMVLLNLDQADGSMDASQTGEPKKPSVESEVEEAKPYATSRPSYGKNQVEMVWENAKDPVTGKVYDPSGAEITWDRTKPRNGQWDMGHIPGQKYSEVHQLYMDDVISKEEFLEWYKNPRNYRPELPGTNRSHKYE